MGVHPISSTQVARWGDAQRFAPVQWGPAMIPPEREAEVARLLKARLNTLGACLKKCSASRIAVAAESRQGSMLNGPGHGVTSSPEAQTAASARTASCVGGNARRAMLPSTLPYCCQKLPVLYGSPYFSHTARTRGAISG